ncbi:hypothetical protein AURDEDRAFT_127909 [Auricularia subglabra TFB-10046 SS5]|nr:hypothetical protein AURDEDRAFT_127909 [Auricularia subglabra TFB-10046 SS5]
MSTPRITTHGVGVSGLSRAIGSTGLRALVLFRSAQAVLEDNAYGDERIPLVHLDFRPTLRALVSLHIITRTSALHDAVAFFTMLSHMPRLKELDLSLVTFTPYKVEVTIPTFTLRWYRYYNAHTAMGMRGTPRISGTVNGWSLPLAVSAHTLRHLAISLREPYELEEALQIPEFTKLEHLELRRNHYPDSVAELECYAQLVARCPRLRSLSLLNINRKDLAHDLQLFTVVPAPLQAVELTISMMANPPNWTQPQHDAADAVLANAFWSTPSLNRLRACALSVPRADTVPTGATLPSTRATCAEGQVGFRLIVQ